VVIQVLPFTASDLPGTDGPILVYDFDGASSVAYTECNSGGRIVESGSQANCVEVAVRDRVVVRDTKERTGPVLRFTPAAWREFADHIKASIVSSS
jgi:hypothetical protein